jgi:hypothetical protein
MTSYLIMFGIFAAVTILVGAIFFLLYDANASTTEVSARSVDWQKGDTS